MKKVFLFLGLLALSSIIIFFSCVKENNESKQNVKSALKNGEGEYTFYSRHSEEGYSRMQILKNSEEEVHITTSENKMPEGATYNVSMVGFESDTAERLITIPEDGNDYWIVPFDGSKSENIERALPGSQYTYHCDCPGDCEDPSGNVCCLLRVNNGDNTQNVGCTTWFCLKTCILHVSGGSGLSALRSFAIVSGDHLYYNGEEIIREE